LAVLPSVIPLFPLPDVVLFPRMPLPLHVFEPRYRKMVADSLEGNRVIGMTLLRPGWEPDYEGRPPVFPVGCAGPMEQCEALADGRYRILLRGTDRFRIREELGGEPYRMAAIEPLEDTLGDDSALDAARKKVMSAIAQAADGPATLVMQPELSHDVFANALCQTLALTPVERQSLLDCDTILARYSRLAEILEFKRLEEMLGRPHDAKLH
jgi:Lon protease-like protein